MKIANRGQAGFTMIELLTVIAVIVIISAMAIPRMQAAKLSANEVSAATTLRAIAQAQAQLVTRNDVDTDSDGQGEYGYLAELAGVVPVRVNTGGGVPGAGGVNDLIDPITLSATIGQVSNGVVTHSGYAFQVWLPGPTAGGLVPGIAEDATGGKTAGPFPGSDNGEVYWVAYAWPVSQGASGTAAFFMSSQGQILTNNNRGAGAYSGLAGGPNFDAALTVAGDMSSNMTTPTVPAVDGNLWVPLR